MSLKFFPKCGNKLEPEASFCEICGADLKNRTESSESASPGLKKTIQEPKMKLDTVIYADLFKRLIAIIFDSLIIGLIGSSLTWFLINRWFPVNFFDPFGG